MTRVGLSLATLLIGAGMATAAAAADVTVTLTGVQAQGGQMLVSLQTREQFMKPQGANGATGPAQAGAQAFTVQDVAPGDYAVMVLHDADNDWSMDRQANGMPAEGWGMSGQAPTNRAPTFDEVKFTVPADGGAVTIALVYPQ
jgi:uncharacterized protein (DUF2141 family)